MTEDLKVRPTPWAPPLDGFHFEAVEQEDRWRLATHEEHEGRVCRGTRRCPGSPVAALNRGIRTDHGSFDAWWFYCGEHLYGRWIEDGKVMGWRLVKDGSDA